MLGPPSALLHERVEAEARQMAFVEHDRVTERDRPAVVHLPPAACRTAGGNARGCAGTRTMAAARSRAISIDPYTKQVRDVVVVR